jgi:hypothetical protein
MVDAPFLQLTPGTRTGIIHDESFETFLKALDSVKAPLQDIIAEEKNAAEEQASRNILKGVQKAFKEAFLTLPPEDYQWFDLHTGVNPCAPLMTAAHRATRPLKAKSPQPSGSSSTTQARFSAQLSPPHLLS